MSVNLTLKLPILVTTHLNLYILGVLLRQVLLVELLCILKFVGQFQEGFVIRTVPRAHCVEGCFILLNSIT